MIDHFIKNSSGIDRLDTYEFTLNHGGDWAKMYCPEDYASVTFMRVKRTKNGDWKTESKEYTLTPGQEHLVSNKEEAGENNIDIKVTFMEGQKYTYATVTDNATGESVDTVTTETVIPSSPVTTKDSGGDDKTSNTGWYAFIFIMIIVCLLGAWFVLRKKGVKITEIPGEIKDKVTGDD